MSTYYVPSHIQGAENTKAYKYMILNVKEYAASRKKFV